MMNNTTTSALRAEHAKWSQETFGDVGPVGPLKHLSKEALEAAQNPADISEWADITMLMWDAQRRAGITDEQLMQAVAEKLAINKQRQWPAPCDGEPREHIKGESNNAQPAEPAAVPDIKKLVEGMSVSVDVSTCDADAGHRYFGTVCAAQEHDGAKNGLMLLVEDAKPNFAAAAPVVPDQDNRDVFECWVANHTGYTKGFVRQFRDGARYLAGSMWNKYWDAWNACRDATHWFYIDPPALAQEDGK